MRFRCLLLLLVCVAWTPETWARIWKDSSGRHTIEAELVDCVNGAVRLRKADNSVITVPLEKLGKADRDWIQRQGAARGVSAEPTGGRRPGPRSDDKSLGMPSDRRSVHEWVTGDGKHDDAAGVAQAFAAARNRAFTLVVDCPVRIHIGTDIARPIFIDNGTSVEFTSQGLFVVDNVMLPAFVIANSSAIRLLNWSIQYAGGLPADNRALRGYYERDNFVEKDGYCQPSFAFNDVALTQWLAKNRGIQFDQSKGNAGARWNGPSDMVAIFYLDGDTSDVVFENLKMFVPESAGGHQFIPMAFASMVEFKSQQTVTRETPYTPATASMPHNVRYENIDLDGYYFGWQGIYHNATFHNIRAHRYGDLQDEKGENSGGVGKWFAPPHLFYLNDADAVCVFRNEDIHISDVIDYGQRVGVARDRDPAHGSGYANSLKFGGVNSSIDHYKSYRPDGLADVLNCNNVTISDVEATYDSSFLNNIYSGIRFPAPTNVNLPGKSLVNLTIKNLTLVDKAVVTRKKPISDSITPLNKNIRLQKVRVRLCTWGGEGAIEPLFKGENNHIDIKYHAARRLR